ARRSRKRVAAFYRRKTQALDTLVSRYRDISTQGGSPSTLFTVLLRTAQAIEGTETELRYLGGEARDQPLLKYADWECCDAGVADELRRDSVRLLERCVDLADEYDYTDPWVEICAAKLGRAPSEFYGARRFTRANHLPYAVACGHLLRTERRRVSRRPGNRPGPWGWASGDTRENPA
ncbi:MAG: hypothetical protein ACPG77_15900, partial [Nannocystaceae bacterium]